MNFADIMTSANLARVIAGISQAVVIDGMDMYHRKLVEVKTEMLAERIWQSEQSSKGRTKDQVVASTRLGACGEVALAYSLFKLSPVVQYVQVNMEGVTAESYWDVLMIVDGCIRRFECKYQSFADGNRTFLSFDDPSKASTAVSNWQLWDFMYSFQVLIDGGSEVVVPWALTKNTAFDPAQKLYVDSQFKGKFLKDGIATGKHLHLKLN